MSDITDLVTSLRTRLDEDERVALDAASQSAPVWEYGEYPAEADHIPVAEHIERWDPHRVLALVDATRRILDRYEDALARQGDWQESQTAADICVSEYEDWIIPALAGYREP